MSVVDPGCPVYGVKCATAHQGKRRCKCRTCTRWWRDYYREQYRPEGAKRRPIGKKHRIHKELAKEVDVALRNDLGLLLQIAKEAAIASEMQKDTPPGS